jgi:rhodanese-related sulfurtransferase
MPAAGNLSRRAFLLGGCALSSATLLAGMPAMADPVRRRAPDPFAHYMTRDELKQALDAGMVVLVDVRETNEFESGHVPGARNMPISSFDARKLPPTRGRTLVFMCTSGVRSAMAHDQATSAGRVGAQHYPGGMNDWIAAGEPVALGR